MCVPCMCMLQISLQTQWSGGGAVATVVYGESDLDHLGEDARDILRLALIFCVKNGCAVSVGTTCVLCRLCLACGGAPKRDILNVRKLLGMACAYAQMRVRYRSFVRS